jgi:hypothetical protein
MNRAKEAQEYLTDRLRQFVGFNNMANSKIAFFESIVQFKETIIPGLRKYNIFNEIDIENLILALDEMNKYKGKGGNDQNVYHSTWIAYGEVQSQLSRLIKIAEITKVPLKYKIQDIICSKAFIITVIGVFLAVLLQKIIIG